MKLTPSFTVENYLLDYYAFDLTSFWKALKIEFDDYFIICFHQSEIESKILIDDY